VGSRITDIGGHGFCLFAVRAISITESELANPCWEWDTLVRTIIVPGEFWWGLRLAR
jgi:hypothetical protein